MTTAQRKSIFGKSKGLGMNSEELHVLVAGLTGCQSLTELTDKQAEAVIGELDARGNRSAPPEKRNPKAYKPAVAGMMTTEQQSLAWRYMYRLRELDEKPLLHEDGKPYTVGERMAGAIHKICGITAKSGEDIFRWVSFEDGAKLIEGLKRYVQSAERKAGRKSNA